MTTFIYTLIDPRTQHVRYVGKSNNPITRYKYYHTKDKKKTHKVHWLNQLKSQGLDAIVEVLDEVCEVEWQFWEQHYISLYLSWGFKLTNETFGGEGGAHRTKEYIAKIQASKRKSAKERGYWHSEETKCKMSNANGDHLRNLSKDSQLREWIVKNNRGRKQSEEEKEMRKQKAANMSEEKKKRRSEIAKRTHKGKVTSEATKALQRAARLKTINSKKQDQWA